MPLEFLLRKTEFNSKYITLGVLLPVALRKTEFMTCYNILKKRIDILWDKTGFKARYISLCVMLIVFQGIIVNFFTALCSLD